MLPLWGGMSVLTPFGLTGSNTRETTIEAGCGGTG
jgi:hypothetical protein